MKNDVQKAYEENMGLIINEIKRYRWYGIDFEELKQIAYFGVHNAVLSYDETRGTPFYEYLRVCLKNSIKREIVKIMPKKMSDVMLVTIRAYYASYNALKAELMREPTEKELAERLGCPIRTVRRIEKFYINADLSLNELHEESGDANRGLWTYEDGFDQIETKGIKEAFWASVKQRLDDKEFKIIWLHYAENKTMQDIAKILNLSIQSTYRKRKNALFALKRDGNMRFYRKLYRNNFEIE